MRTNMTQLLDAAIEGAAQGDRPAAQLATYIRSLDEFAQDEYFDYLRNLKQRLLSDANNPILRSAQYPPVG